MLTSILLPLFGILNLYHTFFTLTTYISNKFLVFLCLVLIIFLQIAFEDKNLPYNNTFSTTHLILQNNYPLWQTYQYT